MSDNSIQLYTELITKLKSVVDQKFKDELLKDFNIESFEKKWLNARKNIEKYLKNVKSSNKNLENLILLEGFLSYEDASALLLELLWQDLHSILDVSETIFYYKTYKIQISASTVLQSGVN